uniref:Uncharacterized protein n=1 Tax=Ciona savignyi TaxID=51511 RepID=H2YJH6_CIOSA
MGKIYRKLTVILFLCLLIYIKIQNETRQHFVEDQKRFYQRFSLNFPPKTSQSLEQWRHASTSCPLELLDDVASRWKPMVKLNPNRFLLPILKNGPNNQLSGLRDSIYISIRLNRTIVLPRFFKHRTDDAKEGTVYPRHRIDLQRLQKLIHYVTMDEFRNKSGGTIDAIFRVRPVSKPRYLYYERLTGINITDERSHLMKSVQLYPREELMADKRTLSIGSSRNELLDYYGSEKKYALFAQPFGNLKFSR